MTKLQDFHSKSAAFWNTLYCGCKCTSGNDINVNQIAWFLRSSSSTGEPRGKGNQTSLLELIRLFTICRRCCRRSSIITSQELPNGCVDSDSKCSLWASQGECQSNAVWMMANCRRSCQSCQGGDQAWKLRQHISSTYENSTANSTRSVSIESLRINHVDVDEAKQLVRVYGRMVFSWNDTKIAWDKDQWGISWLNFYWIQVWTPQIIQTNTPTPQTASVSGKVLAANYTGKIYMWTDFSFIAAHDFRYKDYPNDYQKICYKFDDKRFFSVRFKASEDVKNGQHEALDETHISGWTIDDFEVKDSKLAVQLLGDWRRNPLDVATSNSELCLGLSRNAVYFVPEMLLPALATSLLTFSAVAFQLSAVQPIVLAFSILTQLLGLILVNGRLPVYTSEMPTILKFAGFNLFTTSLLFAATLVLRKIAYSQSALPPPHFITALLGFVDRFLPVAASSSGKDGGESDNYGPCGYIAATLNNLLFAFFILVYIVAITVSFVI